MFTGGMKDEQGISVVAEEERVIIYIFSFFRYSNINKRK